MQAPVAEQRTLLEMQAHDSAIDRLVHRRGSLPEDARLAELGQALAAVDQLAAEREGSLATVRREQARFEDEIEMVTRKARSEDARAVSGKVTSPKELTAIQEEVAALKRRQDVLDGCAAAIRAAGARLLGLLGARRHHEGEEEREHERAANRTSGVFVTFAARDGNRYTARAHVVAIISTEGVALQQQ